MVGSRRTRLLGFPVVAGGVVVAAAGAAVAGWLSLGGAGRPAAVGPGTAFPAPGTITTVAGGVGASAPARSLRLRLAACPVSYAGGALYAGDGAVVRRIDTRTGWLTTPAGDGIYGTRGNGGLATDAELAAEGGDQCGMAATLDASGNLLIAAGAVHVVAARTGSFYGQQMLAGHIYTVRPQGGFGGTDVRADPAGNLVTIDTDDLCNGNCADTPGVVRVLAEKTGTFYGTPMRAGHVYTVAGNNEDAATPGNGGPAGRAALGDLTQLGLDAAGNLLIADKGRTDIQNRQVVPAEIRVVAARDGTFYGQKMTAGHIYAIAGGGQLTGNAVPATSASLVAAAGVTHDGAGNVIIGGARRLRVVAVRTGRFYGQAMEAGDIYTVAGTGSGRYSSGDGGPAAKAGIYATFVAVDGAGNLVFADLNSGTIRVVAVRAGTFYGVAMKAGDIYSITGSGTAAGGSGGVAAGGPLPGLVAGVAAAPSGGLIIGFAYGTSSGPAFVPARPGTYFGVPMEAGHRYQIPSAASGLGLCPGPVAADRFGNVLIADQSRSRVLVAPVHPGRFYGRRMAAGRIYAVAGDGKPAASGNGGPALAAGFSPVQVTADRAGDLFIVDNSGNYQIPGNRILMVAAHPGTFFGVTMKAGHLYTVAGDGHGTGRGGAPVVDGVAATRTAVEPFGAAVDAAGNLVLASDYRVRVVAARAGRFYGLTMHAGYIYTVAGPFPGAHDVAIDGHGNILVLDAVAHVVRLVAVRSGTFYGQQVTAGHPDVVAGRHRGPASLGEGGPATQAWLDSPDAIAVDPAGRLLIAEYSGQQIQAVTP
jgi:hypothetical protein